MNSREGRRWTDEKLVEGFDEKVEEKARGEGSGEEPREGLRRSAIREKSAKKVKSGEEGKGGSKKGRDNAKKGRESAKKGRERARREGKP
jgi:hypothetical protein